MKTILSTNKKEILVDDKDCAWVKNFEMAMMGELS